MVAFDFGNSWLSSCDKFHS